MTVLDATKLESETDLEEQIEQDEEEQEEQEEQAEAEAESNRGPVRTATLTDGDTIVTVAVQQDAEGFWRQDYKVVRTYDTNPHEQNTGDDVWCFDDEGGSDELGQALANATDDAANWIACHSDDHDDKARYALDKLDLLYNRFDGEEITIDDEIFDALPEPEKAVAATPAALPLPSPEASNEAERHFEERKARLAWLIADGHMQLAEAKSRVKSLTKGIDYAVEELETLIEDGPERLPLIDQAKPPEENQPLFDQPQAATPEPESDNSEEWKSVPLADLGLPDSICKILTEENGVKTLGDITKHCESYSLTDFKKIGKAKAEQIEAAMDEFWKNHPQE